MYKEVAQTLQEARKHSRAVETTSASLQPLSDATERSELEKIEKLAAEISQMFGKLYNAIAPKAFGQEAEDGRVR